MTRRRRTFAEVLEALDSAGRHIRHRLEHPETLAALSDEEFFREHRNLEGFFEVLEAKLQELRGRA
jgi:hypothetical protein